MIHFSRFIWQNARQACLCKATLNLRAALETQKLVPIKSGVTRLKYILLKTHCCCYYNTVLCVLLNGIWTLLWGNWSLIYKSLWHYKFMLLRNCPSHVSHPPYFASAVWALISSAVETHHVSFKNVQLLLYHNALSLLYCAVITAASWFRKRLMLSVCLS